MIKNALRTMTSNKFCLHFWKFQNKNFVWFDSEPNQDAEQTVRNSNWYDGGANQTGTWEEKR